MDNLDLSPYVEKLPPELLLEYGKRHLAFLAAQKNFQAVNTALDLEVRKLIEQDKQEKILAKID